LNGDALVFDDPHTFSATSDLFFFLQTIAIGFGVWYSFSSQRSRQADLAKRVAATRDKEQSDAFLSARTAKPAAAAATAGEFRSPASARSVRMGPLKASSAANGPESARLRANVSAATNINGKKEVPVPVPPVPASTEFSLPGSPDSGPSSERSVFPRAGEALLASTATARSET
jgi:hypothetical protein